MSGNDRQGGRAKGARRSPKPGGKPTSPAQLSFWEDLFPPVAENGCRAAAGYRNEASLNNAGSNGNYWSSSLNTSNANNARELNFNSSDHNTSNNNRYNGQSVRPVSALTRTRLLADLYTAYRDARRHKRNQHYQLAFEMNLELNLCLLADELLERRYTPGSSAVFIVREPKQREVFAAAFRDRIVHHLYYNYTHQLFERSFIQDSYSCIKGRGTHYGVNRLEHHIRQVSKNFTQPCYVLKLDIEGYFINIDRSKLYDICIASLQKMQSHKATADGRIWGQMIDYDFVEWLTMIFTLHQPLDAFTFASPMSEWEGLPRSKSLFYADEGCGLPIGNLTSQLFSNIYLNRFDQFMKRELHCQHYGRYVDDSFVVHMDKAWLQSIIPQAEAFLENELGLKLHSDKVRITPAEAGVEFLGQFILPHRRYPARRSLARVFGGLEEISQSREYDAQLLRSQLNSYAGVLSHMRSHRIWMHLLERHPWIFRFGFFDIKLKRFMLYRDVITSPSSGGKLPPRTGVGDIAFRRRPGPTGSSPPD
ncbi:MAG: RNA-directed DNA polymerase [Bacteroidaceae bacterium]|nr:RNA-directed DNA polymerase [Bacteroidaceae bacterium]